MLAVIEIVASIGIIVVLMGLIVMTLVAIVAFSAHLWRDIFRG